AVLSTSGPLTVDALPQETALPVEPIHLLLTSPAIQAEARTPIDLSFVLGASSLSVWRSIAELTGAPVARIHGSVTGAPERSLVFGRDSQGSPQVRAHVDPGGAFALDVPRSVVQWYAAVDPGRSSGLVAFMPGSPRDLVLDVSPGGDLRVAISDADTHAPLTARLLVHGVEGTVDPSFGPDYRASGAGPVIDALRGEVTTPLPSGRYRVAATKGLEWSIDAKTVTIVSGHVTDIALAPRHVVPTPGVVGCDLHVHARPSFDSPVVPEDRVLSLVAAGIDFAVPTEHNIVGNYAPSIETLDLGRELLSVPGVEITTYSKGFGHFGTFPYPLGAPVPPFKHTNMAAIFRAVRSGDPNRYFQLNHPRLPKGIGYFANIGFDPKAPRSHVRNRIDFDGIEVFNGYDSEFPDRVEQVLRDYWALLGYGWRYAATGSSDSHRIQFHWAGYPRTMVMIDPAAAAAGADPDDKGIDPLVVVANVKKGHAVVTSGPIIELDLGGSRPGDEIVTTDEVIHGHLRIRAAPWIDVTRVEVVAGEVGGSTRVAQSFDLPSRAATIGPEPGTLAEAQERTIRLDRDLEISMGPANGWVQVIARGERRMDDVLPFVPIPPLGFTNPVYVVRHPAPPPPFPGVP
ncbi:MAG TPA: CehA/McbA family metallohydrolase, partial [Polyangiaceae bacterium]|nr:CehA/McbA family metallohydrolase [Polyangiaceae bacterium]